MASKVIWNYSTPKSHKSWSKNLKIKKANLNQEKKNKTYNKKLNKKKMLDI